MLVTKSCCLNECPKFANWVHRFLTLSDQLTTQRLLWRTRLSLSPETSLHVNIQYTFEAR